MQHAQWNRYQVETTLPYRVDVARKFHAAGTFETLLQRTKRYPREPQGSRGLLVSAGVPDTTPGCGLGHAERLANIRDLGWATVFLCVRSNPVGDPTLRGRLSRGLLLLACLPLRLLGRRLGEARRRREAVGEKDEAAEFEPDREEQRLHHPDLRLRHAQHGGDTPCCRVLGGTRPELCE